MIKAYDFKLNLALVTFVERDQFEGHPSNKPNALLPKFLTKCDTIMLNGMSKEVIRLQS